jgi:predicted ABC-type ATPase
MSKLRVAERVAHGGHSIPAKDIERRFARSLQNLLLDYSQTTDACQCFLNSTAPVLIFEQQDAKRNILQENLYQQLLNEAGL